MLLAGVAICFFFSSLILFLQYMTDLSKSVRMLRWTMGGFEAIVQFRDFWGVFPFVVSGCLIVWYLLHELNLLATGEEFAFSRGVNVNRTKLLLFLSVSLMVGAVVALCGPIGFVGLMAPHICRLIVGPDHRRLYPAAWLFGGAFGDLRHGVAGGDAADGITGGHHHGPVGRPVLPLAAAGPPRGFWAGVEPRPFACRFFAPPEPMRLPIRLF